MLAILELFFAEKGIAFRCQMIISLRMKHKEKGFML
jgi:hypothetical protein